MQPTLIGYFPKRNATPPPRSAPPNVLELCNVGFCDGLAPKGWVDSWLHNEFWLYDTEMLAWGIALQTENLRRMHDELAKTWDGVRGSVQQALANFIDQHIPPPEPARIGRRLSLIGNSSPIGCSRRCSPRASGTPSSFRSWGCPRCRRITSVWATTR